MLFILMCIVNDTPIIPLSYYIFVFKNIWLYDTVLIYSVLPFKFIIVYLV